MSYGSKLRFEQGSWLEVLYDVYIGVVVGARHSLFLGSRVVYTTAFRPILRSFGYDLPEEVKHNDEGLKVVAVGYGRTGTYSLTLALEELGFPTLHTQHLYENEEIINMWTNEIFLPSILNKTVDMGRPNFHLIAKQFKATADLPMALYFEQVMEEFPDCKFILTTRENSEVWFRSWNTLTKSITQPAHLGGLVFTNVRQYTYYLKWLFAVVNKDDKFLTASNPLPPQNKEAAIASYEEHNRKVRELIPSDRLLEYNVKEGWQPLCNFLEIGECPGTPFPKTNSARAVQVQSISAFIVPLIIVLFVLFSAFATIFQRVTGKTVLQWAKWKRDQLLMKLQRALGGEKVFWIAGSGSKLPAHPVNVKLHHKSC